MITRSDGWAVSRLLQYPFLARPYPPRGRGYNICHVLIDLVVQINMDIDILFCFGVVFKFEHIDLQGLLVLTHLAKHNGSRLEEFRV